MKSLYSLFIALILIGMLTTTGCEQDKCTRTEEYIAYEPVFKRIEEMRIPATFVNSKDLNAPGKIFYYNGYLMINEINLGIHVIDNRNPEAPVNVGFIELPGNLDMAVEGNILYADSYLDLVAIDITDPTTPVEVNRVQDVFQSFYSFDAANGYLVEYKETPTKLTINCDDLNWGRGIWFEGDILMAESGSFDSFSGIRGGLNSSSITPSVAAGGSMARFTVADEHLYTIDGAEIKVFDVTQPLPVLKSEIPMQWGIETLFPMAGTLFIGSNNGLIIYDITNPESPQYLSTFSHATACDPVAVSGTTAYVTLRDGTECLGFVNQLDVLDVSDLTDPQLIKSYPMDNPHGLSIVDQTLYLCEGAFGLKIFDVSDLNRISQNLLDKASGFYAYDVIVLPPGDHVMVVGEDGLYQFDATDRSDLKQISVITINN
ncbi:MAG: hypothetical protein M3R25_05515 [Bacteroidota bacterium]|nr:hypothetical protein [Bacteroidota bacterium]